MTVTDDAGRTNLAEREGFKWPWLQTITGGSFIPKEPSSADIDIRDIAIGLSRESRYNGHTATDEPYSVAQHSVYVSEVVPKGMALWGLLHDASEAYCKDLTWSVKTLLPEYKAIEITIQRVIAERFGLPWPMPPEIKEADNRLLATEQRDLMVKPPRPWQDMPAPYDFRIGAWNHKFAYGAFLRRFNALSGRRAVETNHDFFVRSLRMRTR